jgi:hypothetical protein
MCITNAQLPEGIKSAFGTPLSVAYAAIVAVEFNGTVVVTVVCELPLGVGDHCLYVGVPKAEFVLVD